MNRFVLAAIASIVALAIIAFTMASASDDDDEESAVVPTANVPATTVPAAPSTPVPSAPTATQAPAVQPTVRPDQPVAATPGPSRPIPGVTVLPSGRHPEPAPIDGLDVLTLESFPPQYMLHVKAGLPSGCAEPLSHRVAGRQGNVIEVEVLNSPPDTAICTAIYGMYEININLGSDFTSGQSYSVRVNDKEVSFRAQ
jgi:hypothetical protein